MFENLLNQWQLLQQGMQMQDPMQAANFLSQTGDPSFIESLLNSPEQPLMQESDPLLRPQPQPVNTAMPGMQAGIANATGAPMPQVPMEAAGGPGFQDQLQAMLTAMQQQQLLSQMPDQRSNWAPPTRSSVAQPQRWPGANFAMQQNPGLQQQRRPSLGDLIYGGR